jgi:hypothetical protein
MKKKLFFAFLISLCLVLVPILSPAQETNIAPTEKIKFNTIRTTPTGFEVSLLNILSEYGKHYNYFFTVEEAHEEEEIISPISSLLIELPFEEKEVYQGSLQALDELRQLFPQLIFEINRNYPQIVHIIDGRLKEQASYGLNEIISSISFSGNSVELVNKINQQINNIANPPFMFSHEFRDLTTIIKVKGENLTAREILSNFIKLKKADTVLWIARTKIGQNNKTYVHFPK